MKEQMNVFPNLEIIGKKVVCIYNFDDQSSPILGQTYTIRDALSDDSGNVLAIRLVEIYLPECFPGKEAGFLMKAFKLVEE